MKVKLPVLLTSLLIILANIFLTLNPKEVFANFDFIKSPTPIFVPSSSGWDDVFVQGPQILKENGTYKMWYDGAGRTYPGWELGYAESSNGVSFPSRNALPIMEYSPPQEKYMSHPAVLHVQPNLYQLWYTSYNDSLQFTTRYVTSTDGKTWEKYPDVVLAGTPGAWDSGGIARGRSVVYSGGLYRMWYAAQDSANLWSWKIGYATSPDGIHWTKENGGQPVITKTASWEGTTVAYPNVLLKDGVYHMFYGTSNEDTTVDIVYAYSKDGIVWTKPAAMNPVLVRTYAWENRNLSGPFVLIDGDRLKMWYGAYSVVGAVGYWQIGYASTTASALPTPDPDTIPTAIPTPPPPPTEHVVVIPGITASWNYDAFVNCNKDAVGNWTIADYAAPIYDPVMQALTNAKWIPTLYAYDWRKRIPENETKLKSFIEGLSPNLKEKVNIVGHSMGGLLARSYVEQEMDAVRVEKLLTVGSPHNGAVDAYRTWENGDSPEGDIKWKFLVTLLKKRCSFNTKFNDRAATQEYFPSVNNLLPVFDYLTDNETNIPISPNEPNKNNWLPTSGFTYPFYGVTVATLRGTGHPTIESYRVERAKKHDAALGNWADGVPVFTNMSNLGDGTVLESSSQIAGADNTRYITEDHIGLISSQLGIQKILDFLGVAPATAQSITSNFQTQEAPSSGLFIVSSANMSITDPDGKMKKDSEGLISFINPKSGSYKTLFTPKKNDSLVILIQVLPHGNVLYKEYTLKNSLPINKTIRFDPKNPAEDAMN